MNPLHIFVTVSAAGWASLWVSSLVMMRRSSTPAEFRTTVLTGTVASTMLFVGALILLKGVTQ